MRFSQVTCLALILAWLVMPAWAESTTEPNVQLPPAAQKMAAGEPPTGPPLPNVPVPEPQRRSVDQIAARSTVSNTGQTLEQPGESTSWGRILRQLSGDEAVLQSPVLMMNNTGEEQWFVFKGHDLTPPGTRGAARILYAPSHDDDAPFRSSVSICSGATVDYFDSRSDTPTVELLATYDFVFTWVNGAYADEVLFGNNLAAYVDAGGTVILGQWCLPTAGNSLGGAIMGAAYCPVTGTTFENGDYNGDGYYCVHDGITDYGADYVDVVMSVTGAYTDGTFNNVSNSPAVAWRHDGRVWYSPGAMGGEFGSGQWSELLCNMTSCRGYADILYAPSNDDSQFFRDEILATCGLTVEYFDARLATPSVERLANYDMVITWANGYYHDNVQFGNNLAYFVDGAGGTVVLGQWCLPTALCHLDGAIMGPDYCPATAATYETGIFGYLPDGDDDCTHEGVTLHATTYVDVATPLAGALSDGIFDNPSTTPALIWREDRKVYYSPGNMGMTTGGGAWPELICRIMHCREFGDILYAPSSTDNPSFREAVTTSCGRTVDYLDARLSTPSIDRLANYEMVITWVNYAYDDNVLFGDMLAEYVDRLGGTVVLGQWCLPTSSNSLAGAIMGPDYCPATAAGTESGSYNDDGSDCIFAGISSLQTIFFDVISPLAGAQWDGTFDNISNSPAAAWRPDRRVYCTPGNTGMAFGSGQWTDLVCNILDCREYGDILYAPANPDDPAFREDINASCGLTVDYLDVRMVTPTVERLSHYPCVMTWANYSYADNIHFGDNLASYVDGGGRVILGQWCLPTAGNHLAGSIMLPTYCPATGNSFEFGTYNYNGDGVDCVTSEISSMTTDYVDVVTPVAGAFADGTFDNPATSPVAVWREDRRVYYSPGNMGLLLSTGQWPDLACNMFSCDDVPVTLSCGISAQPSSGVLPFATQFSVYMGNEYIGQTRRMAGRINAQLANGNWFPNWRAGYTNIAPLDAFIVNFNINIPNFPALVGNNTFSLIAEDVTPAPYNQPPYPMSGDTCTGVQVITGIAP